MKYQIFFYVFLSVSLSLFLSSFQNKLQCCVFLFIVTKILFIPKMCSLKPNLLRFFSSAYVRSHFDHFPPKLFPKQKRNLTCDWPKIDTKTKFNSNIEIKLDQIESWIKKKGFWKYRFIARYRHYKTQQFPIVCTRTNAFVQVSGNVMPAKPYKFKWTFILLSLFLFKNF